MGLASEAPWDIAVIGAGAAGLMAALRAAELGRRVVLLEKNRRPGVKILMSGGTRCNITHATDNRGIVEAYGLRCNYHGWMFDETGACREQPFEDIDAPEIRFRDQIRIRAYRVEAKAGLLWAYLGPEPAPLVPNWEPFCWNNGFVQIVFATVPCNWFQCQENSIDPVHFEWMHDNWGARLKGRNDTAPRHLKQIGRAHV